MKASIVATACALLIVAAILGCAGAPAATPSPSSAPSASAPYIPPSPQPALEAQLQGPRGLAFDSQGNLYVSECMWTYAAIEKIDPDGVMTRFAGTGKPGFSGDGGPATSAQLYCPAGIAVGPDGAVYFADHVNNRVRRVDAEGIITTFAGSGPAGLNQGSFSGDGGSATEATLQEPWGVAFDQTGMLYIADRDNARVRRVDLDGVITTVAGSGARGSAGDGAAATDAEICPPVGIAIDPTGNLVVLEPCSNKVRRVGPDGVISTIIGTGADGFSGDGGPAALAEIGSPDNAIFDSSGAMFLLASGRIRRIDADGVITTIAGIGKAIAPTEGSAALLSALGIEAWGLALDADGILYVADGGDGVFRINEEGIISRFAGRPPAPQPTVRPTVAPSPAPTPGLFRAPVHLAAPIDPIVVADFDNDGNLDIAGVKGDDGTVLLLGVGDGSFGPAIDLPGGKGPASIAAADFNSDGRLDIVITNTGVSDMGTGDDDVIVLVAREDGTFEMHARPAGVNPQAMVVGDFNGDDKPDVATANGAEYVSIFAGKGDGTLKDPQNYPIGAQFASGISAADFNGDGNLDLVTANSMIGRGRSDRTASVLLGAGDGTFAEPRVLDVGGPQPIMPVVADLNGDALPDVAIPDGYPTHSVSVLLGQGDGMFTASVEFATFDNPHTLVIADIDGDGRPDLVSGNVGELGGPFHQGIAVLFGLGDGTFQSGVDLIGNELGEGIAAAADLNGDERIDLIVYGLSEDLVLLFNDGAP